MNLSAAFLLLLLSFDSASNVEAKRRKKNKKKPEVLVEDIEFFTASGSDSLESADDSSDSLESADDSSEEVLVPSEIKPTRKRNPGHQKPRKPERFSRLADEEEVEVVIRYRNSVGKQHAEKEARGGKVDSEVKQMNIASMTMKRSHINSLSNDPDIESVSLSNTLEAFPYIRGAMEELNNVEDEHRPESAHRKLAENVPYGIPMVEADQLEQGPHKVTVCVIDTGYGEGHPDLPTTNQHGVQGYSPYSGQPWDVDVDSHGTHCSGTIGAIGSNNIGVTSVNPDPSKFAFYIGKGLSDSGSGSTANVLKALEECMDNGATVVSMSLGCDGCSSSSEKAAYEDAYNRGVLIIAAAGNGGDSALSYPASYPTVMSVAAVDSSRNRAWFSQYNNQVEISAPGVSVRSTVTGSSGQTFGYSRYSGTSMATPHVAGVAALVWSHFPDCSNNQIRNVLIRSAEDRGSTGCDNSYGHGIVRAKKAYDLLAAEGCGAGGEDPPTLSDAAAGGCGQDFDFEAPPTSAPTPCNGVIVVVNILTDRYGEETSWELTDSQGRVQASGGNYADSTPFEFEVCVPEDACTFKIYDSYGDGICCGYGDGAYSIVRNGIVYDQSGVFGDDETIDICPETLEPNDPTSFPSDVPTRTPSADPSPAPSPSPSEGPTSSPSSAPSPTPTVAHSGVPTRAPSSTPSESPTVEHSGVPTSSPSAAPSPGPSSAPSDAPTPSPSSTPSSAPTPCTGSVVSISLVTDNKPGETSWTLVEWPALTEVARGGGFSVAGMSVAEELCVPAACYIFTMSDSAGDGLTVGSGSYSLAVDGESLVSNGGDFAVNAHSLFGNCLSTS